MEQATLYCREGFGLARNEHPDNPHGRNGLAFVSVQVSPCRCLRAGAAPNDDPGPREASSREPDGRMVFAGG